MRYWFCIGLFVSTSLSTCVTGQPIVWGHPAIKAAVEGELQLFDPTPEDMLGLLSLSCVSKQVDDLEGLQYAKNLQYLQLSDNNFILDISVLSGLTQLETLIVNQNSICDISVVAEMNQLRHLDIHHNRITDISAVSDLMELEYFQAKENSLSDLSALSSLSKLTVVNVKWNPIDDISGLVGLERLEILNLHDTLVRDVTPLLSLHSLRDLNLTQVKLEEDAYAFYLAEIFDNNPGMLLQYAPNTSVSQPIIESVLKDPLRVCLQWTPVHNGPCYKSFYRVSRASDVEAQKTIVQDWGTDLHFTDGAVEAGRAYTYWIQTAVSSQGEAAGEYSEGVMVKMPAQITLEVSSTAGGDVVDPGEGELSFQSGDVVTISADPLDSEHFYFTEWQGTVVTAGLVSNPYTPVIQLAVHQDGTLKACFEAYSELLHVDNMRRGPGDPNNLGTPEVPFGSIQVAIEVASPKTQILVHSGDYAESINFLGKAVTVRRADEVDLLGLPFPVLRHFGPDPVVCFEQGETADACLDGFVIDGNMENKKSLIYCDHSSPVIEHCVVVGYRAHDANDPDQAAIVCFQSEATFRNCTITQNQNGLVLRNSPVCVQQTILRGNIEHDLRYLGGAMPIIRYSNLSGDTLEHGNLDVDPLFVEVGYWYESSDANPSWVPGNYHLQSERGHWDPERGLWVLDDQTSPCIDAGDPEVWVGNESHPHGNRMNLGAYGGTCVASRTP